MTPSERTKAFNQAIEATLDSSIALQSNTRDEIVRLLLVAQDQIVLLLANQPSDYQLWQLPNLKQDIAAILSDYGVHSSAIISKASVDAWALGQTMIDGPIAAGGIEIASYLQRLDPLQLEAMRTFMTDRIQDIGISAINKINAHMGMVIMGMQNPSEAITNVKNILGDESRQRATTIVRTEIGRVFEVAQQARREQAEEYLPGLKKQWRRSGKIHSRHNHDAADGQVVENSKPFLIHAKSGGIIKMMHPRDPKAPASETINCGCISIPFMAHWNMSIPGRKAYSAEELRLNPLKRDIQFNQAASVN